MKPLVPFLILGCLWSPCAIAGGFNLTWGEGCWRDNPTTVVQLACDANAASIAMTASFMTSRDVTLYGGFTAQLDIQSDSETLPDWWQLTAMEGCRAGSLEDTADFGNSAGSCSYAWPGEQPSLVATWRTAQYPGVGHTTVPGPNRAQWIASCTSRTPFDISRSLEYYAFAIHIDAAKTTGTGACGGCGIPVTIVLNEISVSGLGGSEVLTTPLANGCLRWQADGVTPCSATPVRNATWGAVKSLYR